MSKHPRWTPDEIEQLREGWGGKGGLPALAKRMGRSVHALKVRGVALGLGPWLDAGEEVTLNQLIMIVTGMPSSIGYQYTCERWQRMGLHVFRRRVDGSLWKMVDVGEFWRWAEAHKGELDFSRFERNALGMEPGWVDAKRQCDRKNRRMMMERKVRWSPEEEQLLKIMLESGATYEQLAAAFRRTANAIRRKIYDLYLPKPKRGAQMRWTDGDLRRLAGMINSGVSIDRAAREMRRSPEAVRGKLEWMRKKGMLQDGT